MVKVAIVYDRVNKWGGAERVLLALHELFPSAVLYTSVYNPKKASWARVFPGVNPSFLQSIPLLRNYHELLGWLTPIAFETFNFDEYDLVISVTSEAAKGIITKPKTLHICYCLTPTRYLWSGYQDYLKTPPGLLRWVPFYSRVSQPFLQYIKYWDRIAAQRPDVMVGISTDVQDRIKKYYGRESELIYPPVELEKFEIQNLKSETSSKTKSEASPGAEAWGIFFKDTRLRRKAPSLGSFIHKHIRLGNSETSLKNSKLRDYFLIVSRLVPYKKVDLAIEAFNELGLPLVVVGTGSEESKLKSMSRKNIIFKGFVSDEELAEIYKRAEAFIMPQEEDFGITALESQAAGTPVIAFKKGGALDTVIDGKTGLFFEQQTKESLIDAIMRFSDLNQCISGDDCINNAKRFSKERFKKEFRELVEKHMSIRIQ